MFRSAGSSTAFRAGIELFFSSAINQLYYLARLSCSIRSHQAFFLSAAFIASQSIGIFNACSLKIIHMAHTHEVYSEIGEKKRRMTWKKREMRSKIVERNKYPSISKLYTIDSKNGFPLSCSILQYARQGALAVSDSAIVLFAALFSVIVGVCTVASYGVCGCGARHTHSIHPWFLYLYTIRRSESNQMQPDMQQISSSLAWVCMQYFSTFQLPIGEHTMQHIRMLISSTNVVAVGLSDVKLLAS